MKKVASILIYIFAAIGFLLVITYLAVEFGWANTPGIIDRQRDHFQDEIKDAEDAWSQGEEWQILKEAVLKDMKVIDKVAMETGVSPRIIVSILIVEQLRLFHSEREVFKSVFAPLKILGNQSQFSWGVMGIKQDTARQIESNLRDPTSPWYLGTQYKGALDYPTSIGKDKIDAERFARLTNEDDRYYSYLYAAFMMKQLISQWEKTGFPIDEKSKPGILATLFNIGFENSKPHTNPQLGGAEIEINKTAYSFGGLARSFYESRELIAEFPR